jgi:hypothetical protein
MDARELSHALRRVARVLAKGEETHPPGSDGHWLAISPRDHAARAAVHLEKYLLGLKDEPHLEHAPTRLLLAVERGERS